MQTSTASTGEADGGGAPLRMHAFALAEVRRRAPAARDLDGMLTLACRGSRMARAIVERTADVTLRSHDGVLTLMMYNGQTTWHGTRLSVLRHMPETVIAALPGRRVHEVVDVAVGGHLEIVDAYGTGDGFEMICTDALCDPIAGRRAMTRARLRRAVLCALAYLRDASARPFTVPDVVAHVGGVVLLAMPPVYALLHLVDGVPVGSMLTSAFAGAVLLSLTMVYYPRRCWSAHMETHLRRKAR
jgi:hypothetical protein